MDTLLEMQPRVAGGGAGDISEDVFRQADDYLAKLPEKIDLTRAESMSSLQVFQG